MPEILELSGEQRAVVEQHVDAKLLVTAGPGAGKTHTLVARIAHLVENESDVASQEMLSLSFSRAAVGELRRRIGGQSNRNARVRSATFDSFATRLLDRTGGDSLEDVGYDRRIELATAMFSERVPDDLADIRHIFIDEAQDLTGVRAEFVAALLTSIGCGFTVFADEAQAIYDFTGEEADGPSFIERLEFKVGGALMRLRMVENHRTRDAQVLAISGLGDLLRPPAADRATALPRFEDALRGLRSAGAIANAAPILQMATNAVILTRRNSEALSVSTVLYDAGVPHRLRRRADDPVIGGWLSRLQNIDGQRRITQASLEEVGAQLPWDPSITWGALCRAVRPRKGVINLDQVADNLSGRIPPDELIDSATGGVVVSTIHRAKGLEFDSVLLAPFAFDAEDWSAELRVLYVGLTRARYDVMSLDRVDDGRWSHLPRERRWRRIGFAGKRRYTTGIEICGSDVSTFDVTGRNELQDSVPNVIDYIHTAVAPGDAVSLRLRQGTADTVYDVTHDGRWVAATKPAFGELISTRLDLKKPLPNEIHGCRVEIVATAALPRIVAEKYEAPYQFVPHCRVRGIGTW
ncbi:UvrD-helicase domain-containing protein [Mycolicibacterium sp. GCM10028919]|uniref:UvrD-helicase domain-containing protein n=1 Tax=Mycolicibacterium sp. GCM10028919 TaxID=3273401 RepID=UPI00361F0FBD